MRTEAPSEAGAQGEAVSPQGVLMTQVERMARFWVYCAGRANTISDRLQWVVQNERF